MQRVAINETTNLPGEMGDPPASIVIFRAEDETRVVYAHVADVVVEEGESVVAGRRVAAIGNNGMCRNPHVHVGAWRGDDPLQIRFDLHALGRMRELDEV